MSDRLFDPLEFAVGERVLIELDGARGVEGEVTCSKNEYGHGVIMVDWANGGDVQCYLGKPFSFTYGGHVRRAPGRGPR